MKPPTPSPEAWAKALELESRIGYSARKLMRTMKPHGLEWEDLAQEGLLAVAVAFDVLRDKAETDAFFIKHAKYWMMKAVFFSRQGGVYLNQLRDKLEQLCRAGGERLSREDVEQMLPDLPAGEQSIVRKLVRNFDLVKSMATLSIDQYEHPEKVSIFSQPCTFVDRLDQQQFYEAISDFAQFLPRQTERDWLVTYLHPKFNGTAAAATAVVAKAIGLTKTAVSIHRRKALAELVRDPVLRDEVQLRAGADPAAARKRTARPYPNIFPMRNKWVAQICVKGKKIYGGLFATPEEARDKVLQMQAGLAGAVITPSEARP